MKVGISKSANLSKAKVLISKAKGNNAQIIVLPECFNCPYGIEYFKEYSEPEQGETWSFLKQQSEEHQVLLIGGSIPEVDDDKIFNTCYVFERGEFLGKHRKGITHLLT